LHLSFTIQTMGVPNFHDLLRGINGSTVELVGEVTSGATSTAAAISNQQPAISNHAITTAATPGSTTAVAAAVTGGGTAPTPKAVSPAAMPSRRIVVMTNEFAAIDIASLVFASTKMKAVYAQMYMETVNPCPATILSKLIDDRFIQPLLSLGIAGVYVVFDGGPYAPKKLTQELRRGPRAEALDSLEALRQALASEHWEGQETDLRTKLHKQLKLASAPDERCFETIRVYFLDNDKVMCLRAPFEADQQCVALQRNGLVRYIFSDDSDLFVVGGDLIFSKFKRKREVLEKKTKTKPAVIRYTFTAQLAVREDIFGPLWEVNTAAVKLEKGGLAYIKGKLFPQVDFFAMLGTDYQPHIKWHSFQISHALFKDEVFGKTSKPDMSTEVYSSPKSDKSAANYWADHKKNVTALIAAPVFHIVADDGTVGHTMERMFELVGKGRINVTLRRLHDTDNSEADDWASIGLLAPLIEKLKENAFEVLTMKNLPSQPDKAVRVFTQENLLQAGHDLDIRDDCANLTRHSMLDVRHYLHLHNVETADSCPAKTLIHIVKRVKAQPELYPVLRMDQLRRADEASPPVLYTIEAKPEWQQLLGVYRFAVNECEPLNTAFFKKIFPGYPSILRRAIWLLTGGRINPAGVSITRDVTLNVGVGDGGVGVVDAADGSSASVTPSEGDGEMILIKATVISSYQNSKYTVTLVFVKFAGIFRFSPGCTKGECVTSGVTCSHILSVLMAMRFFQMFPLPQPEVTDKNVQAIFPQAVKTIGTAMLADFVFRERLGDKRLWPTGTLGDHRFEDDGLDTGPTNSSQTPLERYNVDEELKVMVDRSFDGFKDGKGNNLTAIASKGINVEQAIKAFNEARTADSMSVEAVELRAHILGNHKRAREIHGADAVGAPLIFAMIDSGEYEVHTFDGGIEVGDFRDPDEMESESESEGGASESESESESEGGASESESEE
jgi:5'-3' exonuclease